MKRLFELGSAQVQPERGTSCLINSSVGNGRRQYDEGEKAGQHDGAHLAISELAATYPA